MWYLTPPFMFNNLLVSLQRCYFLLASSICNMMLNLKVISEYYNCHPLRGYKKGWVVGHFKGFVRQMSLESCWSALSFTAGERWNGGNLPLNPNFRVPCREPEMLGNKEGGCLAHSEEAKGPVNAEWMATSGKTGCQGGKCSCVLVWVLQRNRTR